MGTSFRELLSHFGTIKTVDPVVSLSWDETLAAEAAIGDQSPHGRPWHLCLSGETEVVTRQGIRSIQDLVGVSEILVPVKGQNQRGRFMACKVDSYGVAPTVTVSLRRHKQIKNVTCTPMHRWVLSDGEECNAEDLVAGDNLRALAAQIGNKMKPTPFAFPKASFMATALDALMGGPAILISITTARMRRCCASFTATIQRSWSIVMGWELHKLDLYRDFGKRLQVTMKADRSCFHGWLDILQPMGVWTIGGTVLYLQRHLNLSCLCVMFLRYVV